jgi:ATP-dependent RNA helicase DeaD
MAGSGSNSAFLHGTIIGRTTRTFFIDNLLYYLQRLLSQFFMINFSETGLKPQILKAVEVLGFVAPTPIQAASIPALLDSKQDIIGFAATGTGKTAAFSLPIIHHVDLGNDKVQAIILCPTRELCLQITNDIKDFTKFLPEVSTVAVYGGESIDKQIRLLKRGAHIVVGTPGRVCDMLRRKILDIEAVDWLVLDEADDLCYNAKRNRKIGSKLHEDTTSPECPKRKYNYCNCKPRILCCKS